jgi:RNA polymerase sigma-70 factor (ECF subfamily)
VFSAVLVGTLTGLGASIAAPSREARRQPQPAAFAAALTEHHKVLVAVARRLCRNAADADDLLHDTYERALRAEARYDDRGNLRAWLVSIMNNLFIDRCRKAKHELTTDVDDVQIPAPEIAPPPAWANVDGQHIHRALATLTPEFRRVYVLHAIEGRSYDDIARELGIAKATVGTRLVRARQKMKAAILRELPPGRS